MSHVVPFTKKYPHSRLCLHNVGDPSLGKTLKQLSQDLAELQISSTSMSSDGWGKLVNFLPDAKILHLSLDHSLIDPELIRSLMRAGKDLQSLSLNYLEFPSTTINSRNKFFEILREELLSSNQLKHLELAGTNPGSIEIEMFAHFLFCNPLLESLSLSDNPSLGKSENLKILLAGLEGNRNLQKLDLSRSGVSIKEIKEILAVNRLNDAMTIKLGEIPSLTTELLGLVKSIRPKLEFTEMPEPNISGRTHAHTNSTVHDAPQKQL